MFLKEFKKIVKRNTSNEDAKNTIEKIADFAAFVITGDPNCKFNDISGPQKINFAGGICVLFLIAALLLIHSISDAVIGIIDAITKNPSSIPWYQNIIYIFLILLYFFVCSKCVYRKNDD